jgi:hypothetical protein
MYHYQMNLDLAVDIGTYESPKKPGTDSGAWSGHRAFRLAGARSTPRGRGDLLSTPFETFERVSVISLRASWAMADRSGATSRQSP